MSGPAFSAKHSSALAAAVRRINASHQAVGAPELLELDRLWLELRDQLHLADAAGDEAAATRAIRNYQARAMALLEETQ